MIKTKQIMDIAIYFIMVSIIFALFYFKLKGINAFAIKLIALGMMFSVSKKKLDHVFIALGIAIFLPVYKLLMPFINISSKSYPGTNFNLV